MQQNEISSLGNMTLHVPFLDGICAIHSSSVYTLETIQSDALKCHVMGRWIYLNADLSLRKVHFGSDSYGFHVFVCHISSTEGSPRMSQESYAQYFPHCVITVATVVRPFWANAM